MTPTPSPDPTPVPPSETAPATPPPPAATGGPTAGAVAGVPWTGVVEHLFWHPVLADPQIAFSGSQALGFDDWMCTVSEYTKMLQSIYDNGYILVHFSDVYTTSGPVQRKDLLLPEGKKPLIISYDDVNYYDYMRQNGIVWKLIIGANGEIWDYGKDPQGNDRITQSLDVVTILDQFVKLHPDFSYNGAKGTLNLTGYEGILGYRTQAGSPNRDSEIAAVAPIVAKLKATGWDFASHTWGHYTVGKAGLDHIQTDADRWASEVGSLVGPTDILVYPFGSPAASAAAKKILTDHGFRIFCGVGVNPFTRFDPDGTLFMDRMHPDGTSLRHQRDTYLRFYDANLVFDPIRPTR